MKFTISRKQPERKLVAVLISDCMYWEEEGKTLGRTGLFGVTVPISRELESLAKDNGGRCIYEGDTLSVEF